MLIATNAQGHVVKRASKPAIGAMLANLRRGNEHTVLERQNEDREGTWYIQVLLCDNNTYQLEYRDGAAAEHHQTRTMSVSLRDNHDAQPRTTMDVCGPSAQVPAAAGSGRRRPKLLRDEGVTRLWVSEGLHHHAVSVTGR
ncbi:hypothetical protein [Streptomyces sp. B21-083]|uniref:hypothetical protein n=1 Tax=Streptomyces sp. B21-083 TaxID=3039410 RepID=UPI002FF0B0D8